MSGFGLFTLSIISYVGIIIASLFLGKMFITFFPSFVSRLERLTDKKSKIILLCAMIVLASFFTWYAFQKYDGLGFYIFDQGNMEQTVWNTVHGDWFRLTTQEPAINRLHFHVEPIFILLAPLYALWESGKVLLLIQILMLVSGAYAVYRLSRLQRMLPLYSLIFSFIYLFYPMIWRSAVTDFHPLALGVPLMIFGAGFAFEKRYGLSLIFFLLAIASREEYAIMVFLFGCILFFFKDRRFSLFLILFGVLWTLFVAVAVIPTFSPTGDLLQTDYYSYILDEGINVREFAISRVAYVLLLLGPVLFISLRSPFVIIGFVSFLTIIFRHELPFFIGAFHNHVSLIPAIFISAVFGFSFMVKKNVNRSKLLGISMVIAGVGFFLFFFFSPAGIIQEEDHFFAATEAKEIRTLLSTIPKQASVITSNEFGELLPARKDIYLIHQTDFVKRDYVVIPTWKETFCPVWSRGSSACTSSKLLYADVITSLSNDDTYELVAESHGVYVYKRMGE